MTRTTTLLIIWIAAPLAPHTSFAGPPAQAADLADSDGSTDAPEGGGCGGNGQFLCCPCPSDDCIVFGECICPPDPAACHCDAWNQACGPVCCACGGTNQPICVSGQPCQPGLQNTAGLCTACGADGEPCCAPSCTCDSQWLQQYFGICAPCGGANEPFCLSGPACQPGLMNFAGICQPPVVCVENNTDVGMRVYIPESTFDFVIIPGTSFCSPPFFDPGAGDGIHRLWIETDEITNLAYDSDFQAVVDLPAGGEARIESQSRPWSLPDHYYVRTFNASETEYDSSDPAHDATVRSVRFLAAADCQYWDDPTAIQAEIDAANSVNMTMNGRLIADPELRGVLYAGDLTHYSRLNSEFEWYHDSVDDDYERFLFDGLGNHDQIIPTCGQLAACSLALDSCVEPWIIRDRVGDRKRNTVKTSKSEHAHYSWDWHDVHFVQLNKHPGTDPDPPATYCDDAADGYQHPSPFESLDFLVDDLAEYVGSSGRPVVIVHHFGFDPFSLTWWSDAERLAYWNAIAPYNVAAIFTGHNHLEPNEFGWRADFDKPAAASGGPTFIPAFVAAGALKGAYLDVEMNGAGQIRVNRWNDNDNSDGSCHPNAVCDTECVWFANSIFVNSASPAPGYGWASDPYPNVAEAIDSCSDRFPECASAEVTIRVQAGQYPENLTLNQSLRIVAEGGLVRIGG